MWISLASFFVYYKRFIGFLLITYFIFYFKKLISMKKLLLSFLVTAFIGGAVVAQDQTKTQEQTKQDQAKQHEEWDKKVKEELKLTADQIVKYDALGKEYKPKMDAIVNDATLSADVQKERKMALKKEKEAKLFEFLTPEQQTKYKELIEKKKKETAKN
jgi:Ni/Co efflux regulator RcnB